MFKPLDENSDIIKETRERIKKMVDEVKKEGIANCEGIIKYGDPVSSILEVAEKLMPDMIVMGNRDSRKAYPSDLFPRGFQRIRRSPC